MRHFIVFFVIFIFVTLIFYKDFSPERLNQGMASIAGPWFIKGNATTEETGKDDKSGETGKIEKIIANENSKKIVEVQKQTPGFLIDTYIVSGPENGESINRTNRVVFEFKGIVSPMTKETIYFETKIEGLDKDWQRTSSNKRTIDFPAGNKEYTFWVRARVNNYYDPTPAKRTFTVKNSPYFQKIRISSISKDSIILNYYSQNQEKINITGWKIKTGKGGEFVIPQGVEVYPGFSSPNYDIFIKGNDQIYIQSKSSPFGYSSRAFRVNKCFGYLADYYGSTFPFRYGKICPKINREEICYFSNNCQNFIFQLQGCNRLNYSQNLKIVSDASCVEYINKYISQYLNYDGCLNYYLKDDNFLEKRWYIFAGYSVLCRCGKDTIYLYDRDGLLVDKYYYEQY